MPASRCDARLGSDQGNDEPRIGRTEEELPGKRINRALAETAAAEGTDEPANDLGLGALGIPAPIATSPEAGEATGTVRERLAELLRRRGQVSAAELRTAGYTRSYLSLLVKQKAIRRIHHGLYGPVAQDEPA